MRTLACLFFLLFALNAYAEVIEVPHFKDLERYVDDNTLVILDIDDTLLIPIQALGTDAWFMARVKEQQALGFSPSEALNKTILEWEAVRKLTQVKAVEESSPAVVAALQKRGLPVMALSTQGLALACCTSGQLKSLGYNLSATAPRKGDDFFDNGLGVLYTEGILFTSGTAKGKALFTFLDRIPLKPKRIVFINDKESHLRDVESAAKERGVDFVGLRYAFSDKRVKDFDYEIARIQWERSSFNWILSDEEAANLLAESSLCYDHEEAVLY